MSESHYNVNKLTDTDQSRDYIGIVPFTSALKNP
jgi:hypothetical protein